MTKIILTGVTGRIGREVLNQAMQDTTVTSIVALTRRPLPDVVKQSKLDVVVVKDFKQYPNEIIHKLSGASACIWSCMTNTSGDPVLELEYPKAFAEALGPTLPEYGKQFRYLHITGATVERDQDRALWLKNDMRKIKGQGEMQMIDYARNHVHNGLWETLIARPGLVVKGGTIFGEAASLMRGAFSLTIRSDELATILIDVVINGSNDQLLTPALLLQRGQEVGRNKAKK